MVFYIAGIGPGEAGASTFYKHIEKLAKQNEVPTIYPFIHKSFRRLFYKDKLKALIYLLKISFSQIVFTIKVLFLKPQNIILSHPQGIGLLLTIFIILRHKRINFYVLDNSYFCIQSYNYHRQEGECLRCINFNQSPYKDCKSFPGIRMNSIHLFFNKFLYHYNKKIKFFFQNYEQLELFKIHMNHQKLNLEQLGLITSDIQEALDEYKIINKDNIQIKKFFSTNSLDKSYIVFHGNDNDAKGSFIAYEIAKYLPEFNFIFPFQKPNLELSSNCIFLPCSWNTGLKELVISSICVLNTSMWSAPIEGALIKSILYNGVLITAKTKRAFYNEIPKDLTLIYQSKKSIKKIRSTLSSKSNLKKIKTNMQKWIVKYYEGTNLNRLFIFED